MRIKLQSFHYFFFCQQFLVNWRNRFLAGINWNCITWVNEIEATQYVEALSSQEAFSLQLLSSGSGCHEWRKRVACEKFACKIELASEAIFCLFSFFFNHWFTVLEKHVIIKCPIPTQIDYITPDKQKTDRNVNICLSGRTENLPITHSLWKAQIKTLLSRLLCRQVVTVLHSGSVSLRGRKQRVWKKMWDFASSWLQPPPVWAGRERGLTGQWAAL